MFIAGIKQLILYQYPVPSKEGTSNNISPTETRRGMNLGSLVWPAAAAGTRQAGFETCLFILCWKQLSLQLTEIWTIKRKMRTETGHPTLWCRGMCRAEPHGWLFCPVGWTGKEWFSELDCKAGCLDQLVTPPAGSSSSTSVRAFSFHGNFVGLLPQLYRSRLVILWKMQQDICLWFCCRTPCWTVCFLLLIKSQNISCWRGPLEVAWSDPPLRVGSPSK